MSEINPTNGSSTSDVQTVEPPTSIAGIVSYLGPGLIIAASIVGSGELIATTATGAKAGFVLLWLILGGCVIKVFVQVELGRYTLTSGKMTMEAMTDVPGPHIPGRGNWITWYWLVMFAAILAQQGGIIGGVGQALAISVPLTQGGRDYNAYAQAETQLIVAHSEWALYRARAGAGDPGAVVDIGPVEQRIAQLNRDSVRYLLPFKRADGTPAEVEALESARDAIGDPGAMNETRARLIARASLVLFHEHHLAEAKAKLEKNSDDAYARQLAEDLGGVLASLRASIEEPGAESGASMMDTLRATRNINRPSAPLDDKIWASIVTAITIVLLMVGRYSFIQSFSIALVGSFTVITIVNLLMLQMNPTWAVSLTDVINGLKFRLPYRPDAITTALAAFGIIGVGAGELIVYPYWCLEKGYGKFTGPRDDSPEWAARARGWIRVMRWDSWSSMVVYTFATIAFYLLGAAILEPTGLDPKGSEMIRYLAVMYEPVFGPIAQSLFLFGAIAVLYSTFFVAMPSLARVFSDVLQELSLVKKSEEAHIKRSQVLSVLIAVVCLLSYWTGWEPQAMVLLSGLTQSIMLPMLAGAALYFRYCRCDPRVTPGRTWDAFLWISAAGLLVAGIWAAWSKIAPMVLPG